MCANDFQSIVYKLFSFTLPPTQTNDSGGRVYCSHWTCYTWRDVHTMCVRPDSGV